MISGKSSLALAKSVLLNCPEFLTERMVESLVLAGVDLPAEVRERFGVSQQAVDQWEQHATNASTSNSCIPDVRVKLSDREPKAYRSPTNDP